MKLNIDDIKFIVNECVKKLSEVRYIDVAQTRPRGVEKSFIWWEDCGELKNKFINDIQNYLQWNVTDLSTLNQMQQILYPKQIIDILGVDLYRKNFDKFYPEFRTHGNRV